VVAIGKAGQSRVEQQMNNLGDNFVWIEAGGRSVSGVRTGPHGSPSLSMAAAIKNQIALIKTASPNVDDHVPVIYGNQSVMQSLVGGFAGVLFGGLGSYVVGQTLKWPMETSMQAIAVAALFSIAVGVFFGYYPARKASLLDPIEALRHE
jgi:hypothetical protein